FQYKPTRLSGLSNSAQPRHSQTAARYSRLNQGEVLQWTTSSSAALRSSTVAARLAAFRGDKVVPGYAYQVITRAKQVESLGLQTALVMLILPLTRGGRP